MSNHQGPRAGSRAFIVLDHLYRRAHTSAHVSDVRRAAAPNLTTGEFNCTILTSLARFGFIVEKDGFLTITAAGKRYMEPPIAASGPASAPVAARYVAPMRPLAPRVRLTVIREGAFDYRNVPSLHGDQRVPFKPGFPMDGATQE